MKNIFYQGPSFKILHNKYAKNGLLDPKASVKSSSQIVINESINKVWNIVINITDWSSFCPGFSKIKSLDGVKTDASFSFSLNNSPINAKFAVIRENSELSWTGMSLWAKAIDRITLYSQDDNKTLVILEESFSGVFMSLFISDKKLKIQHDKWLNAIKSKVEKGEKIE